MIGENRTPRELEIRPFIPGDEKAIVDLFQAAFGKPMPIASYRWRFVDNPFGQGICELAWDGNRLCAHCGVTPVIILCDGKEMQAGLAGTAMRHPDYRGQGFYINLYHRIFQRMKQERHMFFVFGFPNQVAHPLFVRGLSCVDIYEVPKFSVSLGDRRPRTEDGSDKYIEEFKEFDERFDRLWLKVVKEYRIIVKRDSKYLNWRFCQNPGAKYRILSYLYNSELLGYVVLKNYGTDLQIVDLLTVPQTDIGLALIIRTTHIAQEEKLESVSMWLNPANPLHIELERLGFKPGAPVVYFGGRVLNSSSLDSPFYSYRNWHLMMSDSDVF